MSMQAASLEALEKANVSTALVRALAQVFEFEFTARREELATKGDITDVRTEIAALRSDMKVEFATVRGEIKTEISGVVQKMYLAILGQMAMLLGIFYFFATHLR